MSLYSDFAGLGKDIVNGAESVGHAIVTHPIESAIIAGGTAAIAAGEIFSFGADTPLVPEEEAAVVGVGEAADVAGASSLAADSAAAADAADAGAASVADGSGSTVINGLAKGAASALRFGGIGVGVGALGVGVEYGLSRITSGVEGLLTGTTPPAPTLSNILGGGGGGTSFGSSPSPSSPSLLTDITSSPLLMILLIGAGALLLYAGFKHEGSYNGGS